MKIVVAASFLILSLCLSAPGYAQTPSPAIVDSPNVKILTGLTAQQFQEEMNFIVQGLGVTCGTCHVRGNFASEEKPQKQTARKMLEMVKAINTANFPDYKPKDGESVLGRVTCYTCHRGETAPKSSVGHH
jgi:photosynthetic reaction center cytochrome c subunit